MSIYGTECTFWIEDAHGRPLEVDCQVVPAFIDCDGPGWEWLPPNREAPPEWGDRGFAGEGMAPMTPWLTEPARPGPVL